MKVKICGIKRPVDIIAINQFCPDYIGFIFAPSKRRISLDDAISLSSDLDKSIQTVGVFVNETLDKVIAASKVVNIIQLHGDEDETYIKHLKSIVDNQIIKVVRVHNTDQIITADKTAADYLLLDTFSNISYGGIGKVFDYNLIPSVSHSFFLAGGINIDNISIALNTCAFALDISSGAETNGVKDPQKIGDIITKIRSGINEI